jgi:hypothetical protein
VISPSGVDLLLSRLVVLMALKQPALERV